MQITPGRYRTRDGRIAEVKRLQQHTQYPAVGELDGRSAFWTAEGRYCLDLGEDPEDLVEPYAVLPEDLDQVERTARELVAWAAGLGVVVTVEQRALKPLAMGHYETVVTVREARK